MIEESVEKSISVAEIIISIKIVNFSNSHSKPELLLQATYIPLSKYHQTRIGIGIASTLRFLINVPGRLLILRFFPDHPDLIRIPHLLIFKHLTDEVVLFFFTFYKLLVFVCSINMSEIFLMLTVYTQIFMLYFAYISYSWIILKIVLNIIFSCF